MASGKILFVLGAVIFAASAYPRPLNHLPKHHWFSKFGQIFDQQKFGPHLKIFEEMSKNDAGAKDINDALHFITQISHSLRTILSGVHADLGNHFHILIKAWLARAFCIKSAVGQIIPEFCSKQTFGKEIEWDKCPGKYSSAADVTKSCQLNKIWADLEKLRSSNTFVHENEKQLLEEIYSMSLLFKEEQWSQKTLATVYSKYAKILGIIGNSYHEKLGLKLMKAFNSYFKVIWSQWNVNISEYETTIKKELSKISKYNFNGLINTAKDSDCKEFDDDSSEESNESGHQVDQEKAASLKTKNIILRKHKDGSLQGFKSLGKIFGLDNNVKSILKQLSQQRKAASNTNDLSNVVFGLTKVFESISNANFAKDFGTHFSKLISAFFRIHSCTPNGYLHLISKKNGWSTPDVCKPDYLSSWGYDRIQGSGTNEDELRTFFKVETFEQDLLELIKKHGNTLDLNHVTVKKLIETVQVMSRILKKKTTTVTKEDFAVFIVNFTKVLGILGKASHPQLGDYLLDLLSSHLGEFLKTIDISDWSKHITIIKNDIKDCTSYKTGAQPINITFSDDNNYDDDDDNDDDDKPTAPDADGRNKSNGNTGLSKPKEGPSKDNDNKGKGGNPQPSNPTDSQGNGADKGPIGVTPVAKPKGGDKPTTGDHNGNNAVPKANDKSKDDKTVKTEAGSSAKSTILDKNGKTLTQRNAESSAISEIGKDATKESEGSKHDGKNKKTKPDNGNDCKDGLDKEKANRGTNDDKVGKNDKGDKNDKAANNDKGDKDGKSKASDNEKIAKTEASSSASAQVLDKNGKVIAESAAESAASSNVGKDALTGQSKTNDQGNNNGDNKNKGKDLKDAIVANSNDGQKIGKDDKGDKNDKVAKNDKRDKDDKSKASDNDKIAKTDASSSANAQVLDKNGKVIAESAANSAASSNIGKDSTGQPKTSDQGNNNGDNKNKGKDQNGAIANGNNGQQNNLAKPDTQTIIVAQQKEAVVATKENSASKITQQNGDKYQQIDVNTQKEAAAQAYEASIAKKEINSKGITEENKQISGANTASANQSELHKLTVENGKETEMYSALSEKEQSSTQNEESAKRNIANDGTITQESSSYSSQSASNGESIQNTLISTQ